MLDVCAAIIKEGDRYLICQRASNDTFALQWEFPGGKKEKNENHEECIVRELKEELNLDVSVDDMYSKFHYNVKGKNIFFTFYLCSICGGEITLNVHNDAKWVTSAEFTNFDFMEADIQLIEELRMIDSM